MTCCGSPPFMGSTKICSAAFFSSPVSARMPADRRWATTAASSILEDAGELSLGAGGDFHEDELAVVTVLVPIHARHDDDDGLSIRRYFRAGDPDDSLEVPSSNFRGWASARSSAAIARSAARIPTSDFPVNGAEFLVFVGTTMSPTSASRMKFD